ncbi:YceD family protein [Ignatzschineria larvae DSM 13226]|uniref:Large ribosomal RNA subunit accumulation protein YceD n=1 Tax=Ignatzschineria larvae DSM 13226 TaxID=1111732 RepID=A0ABZ3BZ58_9GAMM|nr:YceD family protein [Ignatzschineria larvae]
MNYSTLSIWQAIEHGYVVENDHLPSKFFPRLEAAVEKINGDIVLSFSAGLDENQHQSIIGTASVNVDVECQRCLEPFPLEVEVQFRWIPVKSEYEAELVGDDADVIIVEEADPVGFLYHVEDELLMALPIIPYHEDDEPCAGRDFLKNQEHLEEEDKKNPFAILTDLLDQK